MPRTKINSQSMKIMNEKLILAIIVENGPLTRVELSQMTKLTPSTISRIVGSLQARNFVEESGRVQTNQVGRRATKILATRKFCLSVIFNVGVEKTEVAVGYLDNFTKKIGEFSTEEPKHFFKRIKKIISELEEEYNLIAGRTYLVFAFPGIVNVDESKIVYVPNLNWENIELKKMLHYPYEIIADNEANLSILAESAFSEDVQSSENAFFLYVSQGIGGGVMINHKVLRGKGFAAAEVGHTSVEARSKRRCHCGNYGCLEGYASIMAPVNEYEKSGKKLNGKTYVDKFDALIKLYKNGDNTAKASLNGFIHYLSVGILNIVNTFNPEIVVFGGGYNSIWELFGEKIYKKIHERAMPYTIDGVVFRDTVFKNIHAPIVGGNVLATKKTINAL